jgi:hypothetical protein
MDISPDAANRMVSSVFELDKRLTELRARWVETSDEPGFAGFEPWQDRLAAIVSLSAVIEFLDREKGWNQGQLSWALTRLLTALNDFDKGVTVPWLKPAKKRGGALSSDVAEVLRGRCAGVMEFFIKTGKDGKDRERKEAAELVLAKLGSEAVGKLAARRSARSPSWRTIDKWREPLTGRADCSPALDGYRYQFEILRPCLYGPDPVDMAGPILLALRKRINDPSGWLALG